MGIALGAVVTFVLAHGLLTSFAPLDSEAPRAEIPTSETEGIPDERSTETAPYRPLRPGSGRYSRPAQS